MSHTIIDRKRVLEKVLYSSAHLDRLEKAGRFPRRVRLGAARVGWVEEEIDKWISDRMVERAVVKTGIYPPEEEGCRESDGGDFDDPNDPRARTRV